MKPRPVIVQWVDSCHLAPGAWVERDEIDDVTPCGVITCAWLIHRTKRRLVLAHSVSESGDVTGVFVVPSQNVRKVIKVHP